MDFADLARKLWPYLSGYVGQSGAGNSVITAAAASGGGSGGGSAPSYASFLTLGTDADLSDERVFTPATTLSATDAGAGSTYTLGVNVAANFAWSGTQTFSGSVSETALGSDNIRIGVTGGTPRIILEDSGSSQWEIDTAAGVLRMYSPSVDRFRLTTTGAMLLYNTSGTNPFTLSVASSGDTTLTPTGTNVVLPNSKAISTATFSSGFAGSGLRLDQGVSYSSQTTLEVDNAIVRGILRVYELVINKIRVSRGSLIVSPGGGKVASVTGSGPYTLTFDDDHGLVVNDLLRAQKFTGSGTYQSLAAVTSVPTSTTATITVSSGSAPAAGYEYAVVGSTSDTTRQGGLFLTADDSGAPFMDIYDGVAAHSDFNSYAKTKARLGKLTGITDAFYGTLSGYGLYTSRAYLSGAYINGSLVIGPGVGFTVAPLLYCAFDTAAGGNIPNVTGHKGQPATSSALEGRNGKFTGAVAIGGAVTNLIPNGSFETNTTGWSAVGGSITRTTTLGYLGSCSLRISAGYAKITVSSDTVQKTISAWVYPEVAGVQAKLGNTSEGDGGYQSLTTGQWNFISHTLTPGAASRDWYVETTGGAVYIDAVLLESAAGASIYADTTRAAAAYLRYTAANSFTTNNGSFVAWVSVANTTINKWIVSGDASGCFTVGLNSSNQLQVTRKDAQNVITVSSGVTKGVPFHLAVTWNGVAMVAYINGVSVGSASASVQFALPTTLVIGAYDTSQTYPMNGWIDDMAFIDRTLTANEVSAIYNSGATLNVTRSNFELLLTDPSTVSKVVANAYGIYGTDASSKPTFSLVNVASTVNGESLTSGDTLLGDNTASKGNVLFDQSAGALIIRTGTTNVLSFSSTGSVDGVLALGASGGIYQGSAGTFASPSTGIKLYRDGGTGEGWLTAYSGGSITSSFTPSYCFTIVASTTFATTRALNFVDTGGARLGEIYSYTDGSTYNVVRQASYSTDSAVKAITSIIAGNTHASGTEQILLYTAKYTSPNTFNKPWTFLDMSADNSAGSAGWQLGSNSTTGSENSTITGSVVGSTSSQVFTADTHTFSGTKSGFHIDHPLHPLTMTLSHTPVDGDQMYTFYAGEVTLDNTGAATVTMPDWFTALNGQCMYQLTCVDGYAPVYVTEQRTGGKIGGAHCFTINGGKAGQRVCWQVTGIRQDPFALYLPFTVERDKDEAQRGTLIKGKARRRPDMTYSPQPTQPPAGQ